MNISYQKNMADNSSYFSMSLRFNFSFSQTTFSIRQANHIITTTESAKGSVVYDNKTNYTRLNNQSNVGKAGIIISAFLDLNGNGRHDANEPKAPGLKFHINGGRIERNKEDSVIYVSALDAFRNYLIQVDKNSFENIAWQIKNPIIKLTVEPNHFNLIEVPVAVMGAVFGTVSLQSINGWDGIGGININIYNSDAVLVSKIITQSNGVFSFMGLKPGEYKAAIDTDQLRKLRLTASPALSFTILSNKEGDSVGDLKFFCRKIQQ